MQTIQIYLGTSRLEMFEDESVELTSSIQDVKDISKIFTDYSQSFTIPASKNNNKIFKHYYDNALVGGYDARFRDDAEIQLNHTPFRKGSLRLNKVLMKSNKAYAYSVTFLGATTTLTRILGDKRLNSLTSLTPYNHDWTFDNVKQGIETGLVVGSDDEAIIYPLISPSYRFIYDSGTYVTPENYRNLANASSGEGLFKSDLKPAIRAIHVIEGIENQYPEIQFSRDFFGQDVFNELYLWLNREAGTIGDSKGEYEVEKGVIINWSGPSTGTDYWNLDGKDTAILGAIVTSSSSETSSFQLNIVTSSSAKYDIIVYNNVTNIVSNQTTRSVAYEYKGLDGDNSVTETILAGQNNYNSESLQFEVRSFSAIEFTSTLELNLFNYGSLSQTRTYTAGTANSGVISNIDYIDVASEMPNIKIIDFLIGLFKMFNLTAYVEDGIIVVNDLNSFYATPPNEPFDITRYVDVETSSVNRLDLYANIRYEFKEPSTRLAVKFDELFDFPFGNEEFNVVINNRYIDGTDYLVQLPFEKVIYEKLLDEDDSVYTNIQYGYFVDKNDNSIKGSPLLFYNCNTTVDVAKPLQFKSDDGITPYQLATYNRPSNVKLDGTQTLNFDAENDEFTVGLATPSYNDNSLFEIFHKDYIKNIFDIQSRIIEITALLPLKVLQKYKLNDRFIINGKKYAINKVVSNLMTGRSNLELITEAVEPFVQPRNIYITFGTYTSGLNVPIVVTTSGGCDSSTIQWSTDPDFPGGGTSVSAGCSGETVITMPSYSTFYYRAFTIDVNDPSNTALSSVIVKTLSQATFYTPETLKYGTSLALSCGGVDTTLYISSVDGLYYDSNSGSGSLVNNSFYSDGTRVYTFISGVKSEVGFCFSYSTQVFKYAAVMQDSCSGSNYTLYYNNTDGLYYTAGDGSGSLFTGSYYSNGNFIYSFSNGVKTQEATCDSFTSETYTFSNNVNTVCDSALFVALYISTNDGLYYFTTSGVGSPVSGGYYFKDGNIYSFSSGVRSLVNPCAVTPLSTDFVMTIDTRLNSYISDPFFELNVAAGGAANYLVFWGDGSSSSHIARARHSYPTAGIYTVVVRGNINRMQHWRLGGTNYGRKIMSVEQWGDYSPLASSAWFDCINLDLSGVSDVLTLGSTSTKNLTTFFNNCTKLTTINNVEQWDVSEITSMYGMFYGCTNINDDLSAWDVSNVIDCRVFDYSTPNWTLPKPNFTNCNF